MALVDRDTDGETFGEADFYISGEVQVTLEMVVLHVEGVTTFGEPVAVFRVKCERIRKITFDKST
jgi:hypothetical protein